MPSIFLVKTKGNLDNAVSLLLQSVWPSPTLKGTSVLIKPNLFEPISYTTGQTTNPHLVGALIKWFRQKGAQEVIVGEGPSYFVHAQTLTDCFTKTGIAETAER